MKQINRISLPYEVSLNIIRGVGEGEGKKGYYRGYYTSPTPRQILTTHEDATYFPFHFKINYFMTIFSGNRKKKKR